MGTEWGKATSGESLNALFFYMFMYSCFCVNV